MQNHSLPLLTAHALKGSAASLTATGVAGLAGRLEAMGRACDLTGAKGIFSELADSMSPEVGVSKR